MIDKNFISIDLELNQPSGKIIQVGAIVGNLKSGQILEEYESLVVCQEIISERIEKLTGIKHTDIDKRGKDLHCVYDDLKHIHKKHECFRNCVVWGHGDAKCLKNELGIKDDEIFLFGRRSIDVKTVYISYRWANGLNAQAGLAKALTKLGLQFKGKKHTAKDDALNTFIIYRELLKRIGN